MKIILKNSTDRYASGVTCNHNGVLTWNAGNEDTFFLIVRSLYGKQFEIIESSVVSALERCSDAYSAEEIIITSSVSAYLFKKVSLIGYKCLQKPARYNVYVCDYNREKGQLIVFYDPKNVAYTDVGDSVRFFLSELSTKKPSLVERFKRDVDTRKFVQIRLDGECPVEYKDGDLFYGYEDLPQKFPITRLMMKNGFVAPLCGGKRPYISSLTKGFEAEIR